MESTNYWKCILNFLSSLLTNDSGFFQQPNHGTYSNPGTQVASRTRILALFHRQTEPEFSVICGTGYHSVGWQREF